MVTNLKLGGLGRETKFEFQYVPGVGKMTEAGKISMDLWQQVMSSLLGILMLIRSLVFLYF